MASPVPITNKEWRSFNLWKMTGFSPRPETAETAQEILLKLPTTEARQE
jgi:hypothetical protein